MITPSLTRYASEGHAAVEGWLGIGALGLTIAISERQFHQGVTASVGEIGVHHGRYFIALALLRQPGERAVAIDVFEDQHLNVDYSGSGNREIFLSNLAKHAVDMSDVIVHKADSLGIESSNLAELSAGQGYRLFSVDGGHQVVNVVHDLTIVADVLSTGGIVVLDDFFNPDWPGVNEGLFQFLSNSPSLAPFCYGDNKLFLSSAGEQKDWLEWVGAEIVPRSNRVKSVRLCGYSVLRLDPPLPLLPL
jgi:Methyltransferase domain